MRDFFEANHDTSDPSVLRQIAGEAALDVDRFDGDVADATLKEEVLAAHVAAVDAFGVEVVPTVIVGTRWLEGAAREADYRAALEAALSGGGRTR